MKQNSSTRALVESGLLTALGVVLIIISIYFPVVYLIGSFLWPLPVAMIYIRHNFKYSMMSLVATAIITGIITGPMAGLGFALVQGILGLTLGYCAKNKKSSTITLIYMSVATFLSIAVMLKISTLFLGEDIFNQAINQTTKSLEVMKNTYLSMGIPKEQVEEAMKRMPTPELIRTVIPSAMIIFSLFTAYITYILCEKFLRRFGHNLEKIRPFSSWYIPGKVAWGIMTIVIISYILVVMKIGNSESYLFNAYLVFQVTFIINGLSAITFFMKNKGVSKWITSIIMFFIITSPLGNMLLIVGMVDYIFNYRKLDSSRRRIV